MPIKGLAKLGRPAASVEVSVTPPSGAFVAGVTVVSSGPDDESWPNSKVHPGPATKKLVAGRGYNFVTLIHFLATATANVNLGTFDDQGNPIETKSWPVAVTKGQSRVRIAFVKA